MKNLIVMILMAASLHACNNTEAKVYKGTIFMSFVDDFENGNSKEVFEIKLEDGMKTLVFSGPPPREVASKVGKKVTIIGSENEKGEILFERVTTE